MPMPRKPDPLKHCEHCGILLARKRFKSGVLESLLHFGRRKFCDQKCMAAAFDARPSQSEDWSTSHYHARKLVPIVEECEALQGFPRGYTLVPYRGKPAADGPRYKALGNSMAVPVMHWIGKRIQMVESMT